MATKKHFTVNSNKKVITIDKKVIPTETDKEVIQYYVNAGYTIRFKSEK